MHISAVGNIGSGNYGIGQIVMLEEIPYANDGHVIVRIKKSDIKIAEKNREKVRSGIANETRQQSR
jgi:hypothetical protein